MVRGLHGSATTTEKVRRAIQESDESLRVLARRYGVAQNTVVKWKKRNFVTDIRPGPKKLGETTKLAQPKIEDRRLCASFGASCGEGRGRHRQSSAGDLARDEALGHPKGLADKGPQALGGGRAGSS